MEGGREGGSDRRRNYQARCVWCCLIFLLYRSNYVVQRRYAIDDPGRYIQTEIHSVKVEAFHMTNGLVGNSTLAAEECNKNANCSSELYVVINKN